MGQALAETQRNGYEMSDINVKRNNCRERKKMISKSMGIRLEYNVKGCKTRIQCERTCRCGKYGTISH